jgi:hypothetical protein
VSLLAKFSISEICSRERPETGWVFAAIGLNPCNFYALVDLWMDSYERAPSTVTLDIDDTADVVHGRQQLSLFHAHYDEHCFLPIHVYDTERSGPVAVVLRPGRGTP